jgi:hypothetical protein
MKLAHLVIVRSTSGRGLSIRGPDHHSPQYAITDAGFEVGDEVVLVSKADLERLIDNSAKTTVDLETAVLTIAGQVITGFGADEGIVVEKLPSQVGVAGTPERAALDEASKAPQGRWILFTDPGDVCLAYESADLTEAQRDGVLEFMATGANEDAVIVIRRDQTFEVLDAGDVDLTNVETWSIGL